MERQNSTIGRDLLCSIPSYKQQWQVSQVDSTKIALFLLDLRWVPLARKFEFVREEIDEIVYVHNHEMQRYEFMSRWNGKYGKGATYGIFLEALCELEQFECMDQICILLKKQTEPGSPPATALDVYEDRLKQEYLRYELQAIVKWPPLPNERFINLAMIKEPRTIRRGIDAAFISKLTQGNIDGAMKERIPIRLEELFGIKPAQGSIVLVEGAPGSGKTTLCWHICRKWGEGELFQQFSHILLVQLRDPYVQRAKSFAEILPFSNRMDGSVREMKEKRGNGMLIILEGWDQLPEALQDKSIFHDLIARSPYNHDILHEAFILVTSRSSVSGNLQPLVNMRVEILGFDQGQIESYICASLESTPQKTDPELLLTKIRQYPKLQSSCYLPLNLTLIVYMFVFEQRIPDTFCSIIIELTLNCLYHYRINTFDLNDTFNTFSDLPDDIKPKFQNLCKLAYDNTMQEKYSFSDRNIPSLGLLQRVQSIVGRGGEITQYFLHSSLRELCAAIHISMQSIAEQESIISMLFQQKKNDFVLCFYSALTKWENESVRKVFFSHSDIALKNASKVFFGSTRTYLLTPGYLFVAAFINRVIVEIFSLVRQKKFLRKGIKWSGSIENKIMSFGFEAFVPFFLETFGAFGKEVLNVYRTKNMPCDMNGLYDTMLNLLLAKVKDGIIEEESLGTQDVRLQEEQPFMDYQEDLACLEYPEELDEYQDEYQEKLNELETLVLDEIRDEMLEDFSIRFDKEIETFLLREDDSHTTLMIQCIHETQNPQLYDIIQPEFVFAGILKTSDLLALQSITENNSCKLQTLRLNTYIRPADLPLLIDIIQKNSTVTVLGLDIGPYNGMLIETILHKLHIKKIHYNWDINDDEDIIKSCELLFSSLMGNQHLELLHLGAEVGNYGAQVFTQVLNSTRLREVDLFCCEIKEEGIIAISQCLARNVFLNTLHLDGNQITSTALHILSESLRVNNSLKVLGIAEHPTKTKLSVGDLVLFIRDLRYNSSLICLVIHSSLLNEPSLHRAVNSVNFTRDGRWQPRLAIDDHYTLNYTPEIYNSRARTPGLSVLHFKSINSTVIATNFTGDYLIENVSIQVWHQTLVSSLQFIDQSKAIRNMCLSQIVRPNSRTVSINISERIMKSQYSVELHPFRALLLYMQYVDGSLCITQQKALKPTTGSYCIESIDSYQNTTIIEECMGNIVRHMMLPLCTCMDRGELCSRCTFIITKYTSRVPKCREDCYECTIQSLGLLLSVISNRFSVCQAVRDRVYTCVYSEQSHLCVSIPPLYIVNDVITKDFCKHSSMFSVLFEFLFSTSSFLHMFIPSQL